MKPMPGTFARLIRQSGLYALGNVSVKAAGLILAPFFLNPAYLSLEAYGYFALLNVTAQLGIFIVGLGLGTGLMRFMTSEAHRDERDALPFTALVTVLGAAVAAVAGLWLLDAPLAGLLLDAPEKTGLIHLTALYVAFKVVGGIPMMMMRIQERAGWYAFAVAAEMGLLIGGVFWFLAHEGRGLEGVMLAYTCAAGGNMLVLTVGMLGRVRPRFRARLVGALVRFGAPLVLAGLAGWFLNAGDRYLLKWLAAPETVGLYDWSARLAGVINMLFVQSFQLAFNVIGLKALGAGDLSVHRRTFRHYVVWTGWAVLGLSLLTPDLMAFLVARLDVSAFYRGAETLVLPLALGFLSYGVFMIANNVLYATGSSGLVGVNVVAAALFNAVMNVALIPVWGAFGAAAATFASYTLLAVLAARGAERRRRVGYPWRVFVVVVLLIVALYVPGLMIGAWPKGWRMAARIGLTAAYVPLLLGLRLYTKTEVWTAWERLRGWWKRRS